MLEYSSKNWAPNLVGIQSNGQALSVQDKFTKNGEKGTETQSVSTSPKSGISVASTGNASTDEMIASVNKILDVVDKNDSLTGINKLLAKIDDLVNTATAYTKEGAAKDAAYLSIERDSLLQQKIAAVLAMSAGVEGAAALYDSISKDYNTKSFLSRELKDNPERYYAGRKAELYAGLAQYASGVGNAIGQADVGKGQIMNALSNMLNTKANTLSAQASIIGANANVIQANAQKSSADTQKAALD